MMKGRSKIYSVLTAAAAFVAISGCDSEDSNQCLINEDCGDTSVYRCDSLTGKCVELSPAHCSNKVKDDDETDVDCGGSCPTKCDIDKSCAKNSDCASGNCAANKCDHKSCTKDDECATVDKTATCFLVDSGKGYCVSCSNGVLDGDETDTDCGGSCSTKCANGKKCLIDSDCANGTCSDSACTGDPPKTGDVTKMYINEVMSSPDTKSAFQFQSSPAQCDFIEIISTSDENQSLDGMTLNIVRVDGGKEEKDSTHQLTGILPAKGAVVVLGKGCGFKPPTGVSTNIHAKSDGNFLTASPAEYDLWITDASKKDGDKLHFKPVAQGKSANRSPDRTADAELASHETVSEKKYPHSPGYCANGGLFIHDCISKCDNGALDEGETDVDCGGSTCDPCDDGKKCLVNSDCASQICNSETKTCDKKPCKTDDDCAEGQTCIDSACLVKATCSDGIKNQDETDVDCGGSVCGKCANTKACQANEDCISSECVDNICAGDPPQQGSAAAMFINEVMSNPDKSASFAFQSTVGQCDFIEIVSSSDKDQILDGMTLNIVRIDGGKNDTTSTHKMKGVLPANGAVVIMGKGCEFEAPAGVSTNIHAKSDGNFLTASPAVYEIWIADASGENADKLKVDTISRGKSANRSPDRDPKATLALHNEVSESKLANSPGYCANGGLFIHDCISKCDNGALDEGETDVDCGGSTCNPCSDGKKCLANSDCASQSCNPETKTCDKAPCKTDDDCAEGETCHDGACLLKATCSDGIKNQDETDVDCGGSVCDKCADEKACQKDEDCASNRCVDNACTADNSVQGDVTTMFINEVMANPDTGKPFDTQSTGIQCDFVEIVNKTDKDLLLDGVKLEVERLYDDGSSTFENSHDLTGTLPANGAVVVYENRAECNQNVPEGVTTNTAKYNFLVQSANYKLWLSDKNGGKSAAFEYNKDSQKSMSSNRNPDRDPSAGLVEHKDVPGSKGNHSPGYCANGGLFTNGCKAP